MTDGAAGSTPKAGGHGNESRRSLPAHITAGLAHAGGPADSAGRPWAGRQLTGEGNPLHRFDDDDGLPDPAYLSVRERFVAGLATEAEVAACLAPVRLFVPIVARLGASAEGLEGLAADKQADMALITLQGPDGRKALPVFSSVESLSIWHAEARPVAVQAGRAALSAVSEGAELLVLDPGNDVTVVLRRPALWALARGQRWTPSYEDPELADIVGCVTAQHNSIRGVRLEAGPGVASRTADGRVLAGGGSGPELRIILALAPGLDRQAVSGIVGDVREQLAANRNFAERVDSLDLKLEQAQPGAP